MQFWLDMRVFLISRIFFLSPQGDKRQLAMSGALDKQIRASQKFLRTVQHLPSFAEAREKQADALLKEISKTPVQVEQAAAVVELLDSSIWGPHVYTSKSAVTLEDSVERKYVPLQDYLALPHYLTTGLWKSLAEDFKSLALEKLCKHCRQLGLSNASEVTQAMILTLVFDLAFAWHTAVASDSAGEN